MDHLKGVEEKSDRHQMKGIDFIYMINLDQRPEKFEASVVQLHPYGIFPYRFSAVNGWELPLEVINDVGVRCTKKTNKKIVGTYFKQGGAIESIHGPMKREGQTYFGHCMSPGAIGIVLSHLSVLKDAYDSGYETIWVMEDDIQVIQDPNQISELVEQLDNLVSKKGWDLLFTDQNTKDIYGNYCICLGAARRPNLKPNKRHNFSLNMLYNDQFRRIGMRYGAYSMIVRRSGMKKLLDFFRTYQVFLPFDLDYIFPENFRMYTVLDDVVSTKPGSLSDNGRPSYLDYKSKE